MALFRQETVAVEGAATYKYTLFSQGGGQYVLYLEDEKDPTKRFASDPFPLEAGEKPKGDREPIKLNACLRMAKSRAKPCKCLKSIGPN